MSEDLKSPLLAHSAVELGEQIRRPEARPFPELSIAVPGGVHVSREGETATSSGKWTPFRCPRVRWIPRCARAPHRPQGAISVHMSCREPESINLSTESDHAHLDHYTSPPGSGDGLLGRYD